MTVRDITTIEADLDAATPLSEPEPAVVIHLARIPLVLKLMVWLTDAQVSDLGLPPGQRHLIPGEVLAVGKDGKGWRPEVAEERRQAGEAIVEGYLRQPWTDLSDDEWNYEAWKATQRAAG